MAPEQLLKKRKASIPADEVERVKKVKKLASEVSAGKRKAIDEPVAAVPKKVKTPKQPVPDATKSKATKEAAHKELSTKSGTEIPTKKPKSSKDVIATEKKLEEVKTAKGGKAVSLATIDTPESEEKISFDDADEDGGLQEDSDNEEVDDQTEALLKGFESDDDEEEEQDGGYKTGEPIPEISKKLKKRAKQAGESSMSDKPGVIYLGRIPHGFYEHEMRQYFGQFGDILRLRLSRNRKTGRSKHFAFLEFKSNEVAEIVVKTMDNYLLFGHILKCKLVEPAQIHENLWKGANKRFKKVPWNKIQGRKLQHGMTEEDWNKRIAREETRRADKAEKMKSIGYEFDSPALKAAKGVPKIQEEPSTALEGVDPKAIEAPADAETVESALVITESEKSKKKKKGKKATNGENGNSTIQEPAPPALESDVATEDVVEEAGDKKKSKKRGSKGNKTTVEENAAEDSVAPISKKPEQLALALEAGDEEIKEKKTPRTRSRSKKPSEDFGAGTTAEVAEVMTLEKSDKELDEAKPKKAKKARKSKSVEV